jgi:hypothetical protein
VATTYDGVAENLSGAVKLGSDTYADLTATLSENSSDPANLILLMKATTEFSVLMDACSGCMKAFGDGLKSVAQKIG